MSGLAGKLKRLWFGIRGVDPEAVVVTFATGGEENARAVEPEVRQLIPERRHFVVRPGELESRGAFGMYRELKRRFRGLRIGMTPVLFDSTPQRELRLAAFLLAPRKVLAYNSRLERHHLQLSQPISSWLFWRGVPLDRIHLRPWFWPWRTDRSVIPDTRRVIEGRPASSARAKVAVLTPYFPYPLSHGGAVRIFHLLREASVDFDITLFAFTERETDADFEPVREFCHRLVLVPKPRYREPRWSTLAPPEVGEYRSPAMQRALRELSPPLLQTEYTQLAEYGGQILVEHDVTFDLYRQVRKTKPTCSAWWDWWRWRRFETDALSHAQAAVVMSEKDAALTGHPRAVVIANGVDLARFAPTPEPTGRNILFIGSFRHFPNVVAFRFLVEQVLPRLENVAVTVVAGPDPALHWTSATGERKLPDLPGVRLLGFVSDVKPLYDACNVVVVPTLVSAGTNLKVLEAMAAQRAVVSTSSGCAGLGLEDGKSVLVTDDPAQFAAAISRLLGDASLRERISAEARRIAIARYSWRELGRLQRNLWHEFTPAPLTIREATAGDLSGIEKIQAESPEAAQWNPADYPALIAELGGRPAGFAVSRQTAPDEREILNIAVAPEFRRSGIGAQLLDRVLSMPEETFFLEVRESNQAAQALYRRAGFTPAGRRPGYYENPNEAAIVMRFRKC
ncbi:MAG: ribosomal protein S18-alanine N-acetyltransferase [Bryobacteraceae bacterium]